MKVSMKSLINKKILVIGSGLSGISAVKLLHNIGAFPVLYDDDANKSMRAIKDKLPQELNLPIFFGTLPPDEILNQITIAVVSPGVNLKTPAIQNLIAAGVSIIGEIELAYLCTKGRIIAITGTNGKTTTVSLVGEIMKAHFPSVYVVGNIGRPFCEIALETTDDSIIVLEASSFQLETIKIFTPYISVLLNVTPDHLDRHGTMTAYAAIKERITENQTKTDLCILNFDNHHTANFAARCPAQTLYFSASRELNNGCYLKDDRIYYSENGIKEPFIHINETKLVGICNMENIMAAILISLKMKIPYATIRTAIKTFRAVEHRIEYIATQAGIDYYNDSKATNPDAAIQAIKAMAKPTILLAGGSDKKNDYTPWLRECRPKLKALVLIGETKHDIAASAAKLDIPHIYKADTLEAALAQCQALAAPGDAILLSPACASLDMFENYEARGTAFKKLVMK